MKTVSKGTPPLTDRVPIEDSDSTNVEIGFNF